MSLTHVLLAALGLSLAANLWLFNSRDRSIAELARQDQANAQLEAVGMACSSSVDALAADTKKRARRLEDLLVGESTRILTLQHEAAAALAARPRNPADLCGSIREFWRDELRKERAATQTTKREGAKP